MTKRLSRRRGLTLIDVVTLAAIVLTASTFVVGFAYQAEEEVKRQGICRERLRIISQCFDRYSSIMPTGDLPGYMSLLKRDDEHPYHDPRTNRIEPVSWVVMLLPVMDRQAVYKEWRTATPAAANGSLSGPPIEKTHVYLDFLVCPNEAPAEPTGTPLSYAVNTGIPDFPTSDNSWSAPPLPAPRKACTCPACDRTPRVGAPGEGRIAPRDQMSNGVFLDGFSSHPLFIGSNRGFQTSSLGFMRDRKDQTLLLAENVDTANYTFDPSKAEVPTAEEIYPTVERRLGVVWAPTAEFAAGSALPVMTPPKPSYQVNVDAGKGNGANYDHSRPSSKHPGGVNAAFAGGNVHFLKDSLSYFVYVKLMTSNDQLVKTRNEAGNLMVPMPPEFIKYQLTDGDVSP